MGTDPRDAEAKRKAVPVVAEFRRRFLEEYVPVHCKPRTQGNCRRSVNLFIDPTIGEMRIAAVKSGDIATPHFDLRDKPYQANRTLGVLSKMFSLAQVWALRPGGSKPCPHAKHCKENKREPFLSRESRRRRSGPAELSALRRHVPPATAVGALARIPVAAKALFWKSRASTPAAALRREIPPRPASPCAIEKHACPPFPKGIFDSALELMV